ncbi:hypothetical protein [Methylorubrum thiocyanatum]|uniref:hypothetical protein n=1 Tax=Methylorubrum thiocyanatum TaxID=47958 RepID=UPI0035C7D101
MAPDKSLAAEIEAVRNCQTLFLADYAEAQASSEATDRHAAALMAKGLSNAVDRLRAALAEQEKGDA